MLSNPSLGRLKPVALLVTGVMVFCGAAPGLAANPEPGLDQRTPAPWEEAGLDAYEAAAHLLRRFTYGSRPGEVVEVVQMGLENWLDRQFELGANLGPSIPNSGLGSEQDQVTSLQTGKLRRALSSEAQMREVLVDFWFNHFNVAVQRTASRPHLWSYENEAIRPRVFGKFRELLEATSRHPAMLLYLDNARSVAPPGTLTLFDQRLRSLGPQGREARQLARRLGWQPPLERWTREWGSADGWNENYARELLELHTLGVNGGYSQADVIDVARAFTGWTVWNDQAEPHFQEDLRRAQELGVVLDENFIFRADQHDSEPKNVLGHLFLAGGGLEEGEKILDLLAGHPSTAHRIASKLALRFVHEPPPADLVDHLAQVFVDTDGDLEHLLRALVRSPEFWHAAHRPSKLKTPFELALSALRALDATVEEPEGILGWLQGTGQGPYAHLDPDGYPDDRKHWIHTGSMLNRFNFGIQLARGNLEGVRLDLGQLLGHDTIESNAVALETFLPILLPERDLHRALWRLSGLHQWEPEDREGEANADPTDMASTPGEFLGLVDGPSRRRAVYAIALLINSPEFQQR